MIFKKYFTLKLVDEEIESSPPNQGLTQRPQLKLDSLLKLEDKL